MKYLGRAVRYLLKMAVLIGALLTVLYFVGWSKERFWLVFTQWQGVAFVAIIVVWAFIYAKTGFVKYTLRMGMASHRTKIIEAMSAVGYKLSDEKLGKMSFRAASFWTRITLVGDDLITITALGTEAVEIEGARTVVAKVELRLMRAAVDEE